MLPELHAHVFLVAAALGPPEARVPALAVEREDREDHVAEVPHQEELLRLRVELPDQHRDVVRPQVLLGEAAGARRPLCLGDEAIPVVDAALAERRQPLDVLAPEPLVVGGSVGYPDVVERVVSRPPVRSFWNVSGFADWTMLEGSARTFSACIQ